MASEHILEPLDYLYEELPPERMAAVRQHLADCPRCRKELRSIRETVKTYRQAAPPLPPAGLAEKTAALALAAVREGRSSPSAATVAQPVAASLPQSTVGNPTASKPVADDFTAAGSTHAVPAAVLSASATAHATATAPGPVHWYRETPVVDANTTAHENTSGGSGPTVPVADALAVTYVKPAAPVSAAGFDFSRDIPKAVATVAASSSSDATSTILSPAGPAAGVAKKSGNISQEEMEAEFARFKAEVMREIPRGWRSWLYHPAWTVAASVIFLCSLLMHLSPRLQPRLETHYLAVAPVRESQAARQLRDRERLPPPVPAAIPEAIPLPPPGPQTALLEAEALNEPPQLALPPSESAVAALPSAAPPAAAKPPRPDPDPLETPSVTVAAKAPLADPPATEAGAAVSPAVTSADASPSVPVPSPEIAAGLAGRLASAQGAGLPGPASAASATLSVNHGPEQKDAEQIGSLDTELALADDRSPQAEDRDDRAAGPPENVLPVTPLGGLPAGTDNFAMVQSADDAAVYPPERLALRPTPAASDRLPKEMPLVRIPPLEAKKPATAEVGKISVADPTPDLAARFPDIAAPTGFPDQDLAAPIRPPPSKERLGRRSRAQPVFPVDPAEQPLTGTSGMPPASGPTAATPEAPPSRLETPPGKLPGAPQPNADPAPVTPSQTPGVIIMNLNQPEEPPQIVPRPTPLNVQQSVNSLIGLIGMQIANREWNDAWKTVGMLSYYDEQSAKQMLAMLKEAQLAADKETAGVTGATATPPPQLQEPRNQTESGAAAQVVPAAPPAAAAASPAAGAPPAVPVPPQPAPVPPGVRVVPVDPVPEPAPGETPVPVTEDAAPGASTSPGAVTPEVPSYAAYLVDYVEPLENPPLSVVLVPGPPPAGFTPSEPVPASAPASPALPPTLRPAAPLPPANIWAPTVPPQPPIIPAAPPAPRAAFIPPQAVASPGGDAAVSPEAEIFPAAAAGHSGTGLSEGAMYSGPAQAPRNDAGKVYILREDPFERPHAPGSVLVPAADPAVLSSGPARVTALAETALIPAEQALSAFPMLTGNLPDGSGRPVYAPEDPVIMNPVFLTDPGAAALTTAQFHSYPLRQLLRKRMIAEQAETE